jgi:DNA-3-methyladenine glycosylase II
MSGSTRRKPLAHSKSAGRIATVSGVELRVQIRPASPFKLPMRVGKDGVTRRRGSVIERLLHDEEGEPVVVRAAQTAADAVLLGARAGSRTSAEHGIARMRFALGVDDDLSGFLLAFTDDPLIGWSVRTRPWLRVRRRPEPFEALVWAVCEQLIDYDRAAAIQRRIVARLGRAWDGGDGQARGWGRGLRDSPTPATVGMAAPAVLESCDLAGARAIALRRAAREVASGRVELKEARLEPGWRRLRAIPGIGAWTVEMLALRGQGRYDQLPAGDLGLIKLAGRILTGGDRNARASEEQVRELFAPYGEWAGLAAVHAMGL